MAQEIQEESRFGTKMASCFGVSLGGYLLGHFQFVVFFFFFGFVFLKKGVLLFFSMLALNIRKTGFLMFFFFFIFLI